eukprot:6468526-Amphidinium_carterae.1
MKKLATTAEQRTAEAAVPHLAWRNSWIGSGLWFPHSVHPWMTHVHCIHKDPLQQTFFEMQKSKRTDKLRIRLLD